MNDDQLVTMPSLAGTPIMFLKLTMKFMPRLVFIDDVLISAR